MLPLTVEVASAAAVKHLESLIAIDETSHRFRFSELQARIDHMQTAIDALRVLFSGHDKLLTAVGNLAEQVERLSAAASNGGAA